MLYSKHFDKFYIEFSGERMQPCLAGPKVVNPSLMSYFKGQTISAAH